MTIEREEPGVLVATCDQCGERLTLDAQPGEDAAADKELEAAGWDRRAPEKGRLRGDYYSRGLAVTYPQDFCADCRTEEPRPAPRFGSGRRSIPGPRDAFSNDPHDEWPRALVFESLGLRPDCGHPREAAKCQLCEEGYPIGRTDQWWKR